MFPDRLKALRKGRGLTLNQLAKALNQLSTTVNDKQNTGPQIGSWEREINTPSYLEVLKLASFFEVSMDFLVGRNYQELDLADIFAMNTQLTLEGHLLTFAERQAVYGLLKSYLRGRHPQKPQAPLNEQNELTLPLDK
ncbi:MAG: helix-turn-helix transcriptional regulator [Liquorilactobacillus ghanensis]|uniref:helix-turn-helix domain-containing protein n=1 Tax=Liquorilactobacillus ghanensis TaxID=399370 RepID=UPI0039ED3C5E